MSVIYKIIYSDNSFFIGSCEGKIQLKKIEGKKIINLEVLKVLEEGTPKRTRLLEHKKYFEEFKNDENLIRKYNPIRTEEDKVEKAKENYRKRVDKMKEYYVKNKEKLLKKSKERYEKMNEAYMRKMLIGKDVIVDE